MRLSVNHFVPLAALVFLSGCGFAGSKPADSLPVAPASGPAADYPVVIGAPFTIGAITYRPADKLNYDAVGYAGVSDAPDTRVSIAHKTMPLPSYAEITHLETGRTILTRVETRGPMVNDRLVELSQGAAIQLGIGPGSDAPIRVRRVNPPEQERALLRSGGEVSPRMDTPQALLKVLKRKLVSREPLAPAGPSAAPQAQPAASPANAAETTPVSEPARTEPVRVSPTTATPQTPAATTPAPGNIIVQVAAFSTRQRADTAAKTLGAHVSKPGKYWYVRFGPFASLSDAQAALEKARSAGYSDARIQRTD